MGTVTHTSKKSVGEINKLYSIFANKDGTITVVFRRPIRLTLAMLFCLLFDGVGFRYAKHHGKYYLVTLECTPWQWELYKKEWGMN